MFKKFNKLEKSWIYYNIGNSAFTMIVATIIPIWFKTIAADEGLSNSSYLAFWSYATSIATIVVALIGPIFGAISDNQNFKKPMFTAVILIGVLGCTLLGIVPNWFWYLIIYIIAKVCYQASLVLYDSMLPDITTTERMDLVSSQGCAWGYLGSCIPFLISLGFYAAGNPDFLGIMDEKLSIFLAFLVVAVWWFCVSVPLLKNYKQKYYVKTATNKVSESFLRLKKTIVTMYKSQKKVFLFLLAFFFYIDGVYTIIDEAVAIGTALGLHQVSLLIILLLTQIVAFVFASLFGKLSEKYSSVQLIKVCILGYIFVAVFGFFMKELWQFAVMAFSVGMFQGAIQALSRSYYAQIIPSDSSGEYFGIYVICGKGAAFTGITLIGLAVSVTNSVNIAVATLTILLIIGYILFHIATKDS